MTASKVLKWILFTFASCFVLIAGIMSYKLGVLKDPVVLGEETREFHLLYKDHIGPYHNIVETISKVEAFALENRIACRQTFGEFLDNPELVDPDRLRSRVGCVLNDPSVVTVDLPKGISLLTKPKRNYFKISFDGSPAIGPMKVYPLAKSKWSAEMNSNTDDGVIEIYIISNGGKEILTEYFFPLKPQP